MPSFALYCKLKPTGMLLLLTVFRIKDIKAFKERFFVRALVIINFGINFHFYTRHVYRFKISVIGLLDL